MDPDENRRDWAERSEDYSPEYYAEIGHNEVSETIVEVLEYYAPEDAGVLEVGCGSGRHLDALREAGYRDLAGIDINEESFEVMAKEYPRLADTGTFLSGAMEDHLPEFPDDAYDVVYSVETLQHVHPDDTWVFEELVRITDDLLITAENEGNRPNRGPDTEDVSYVEDDFPLYHRDWKAVFTDLGLAQIVCERTNRDTIRVFRSPE
ncbi:class I SAM-dependent methyltransferase [Halorhabdus sp. CBA1104]|uniref:class I SAM-dependent methyltransferase n=1 Tax=Halorhabdus sp. CBA1104 TaxID=1380432 RepID=UPI0012B31F0A|nr:class I SAM-dependent methyltransferase [Halorhabdus sp. CBA1104]QGN07708.1 class I SAM-dependent methyltransferase [Halorhabdus sp. CBA1104]